MIYLGMAIGLLVGVVFTTWIKGVEPSEPRPQ